MNRFGFSYFPSYQRIMDNGNINNYTVQAGDSLYKIAKKYNVTIEDIMKENDLVKTVIYPGQVIIIPKAMNNGAVYFEEYIISENESINDIANKLNINVNDIIIYNDITKLMLASNQNLKIPYQYVEYEVVATDTLDYILRKTGMTCDELIEANMDKWLKVGSIIYVKK